MQFDIQISHDNQSKHHRERHDAGDDDRGAEAEKQKHHQQHDSDGLRNVDQRIIDRAGHLFFLIGRECVRYADRLGRFLPFDQHPYLAAHFLDVLTLGHFNAEHDCGLSVEIDRLLAGFLKSPSDGDKIFQPDKAAQAAHLGENLPDCIDALQVAICLEDDGGSVGVDVAGRKDDVLGLQIRKHLVDLYAHRRQLAGIEFKPDALFLFAIEADLADSFKSVERTLQGLRAVADFRVGEPLACNGYRCDGDIAVIGVDEGSSRAIRQVMRHFLHLDANVVENAFDGIAGKRLRNLQLDDRAACGDQRVDCIDFSNLARLALDRHDNQVFQPVGRHPREKCGNNHRANGDRRIFALRQIEVAARAQQQEHCHEQKRQARFLQSE